MTRRTVLSTFIALVVMTILMLVGNAGSARAQQNLRCCTYTVAIDGLSNACPNIRLAARWDCLKTSIITSYTSNGIFVQPTPGPIPCPPACRLTGISLDNVNFIGPNETKTYKIGDCCYRLSFGFDNSGCIYIKITPSPVIC